jgi:Glycosyl hydrolase family 63 N-terminal domain
MKLSNALSALVSVCAATAAADDTAILYKEIARNANQSLLWGPYRPNLYFGVRPRIPKSLMGGLMWSKVENFQDVQNSRSFCPLCANWVLVRREMGKGEGDTGRLTREGADWR